VDEQRLLGEEWYRALSDVFTTPYWNALGTIISLSRSRYEVIPPKGSDLFFRAFRECPVSKVRVVILGQDPYPDGRSFDGFAFSNGRLGSRATPSPSLQNIFREVSDDVYKDKEVEHVPDLKRWVDQGVLLINVAHTVIKNIPMSHTSHWEQFTKKVISVLNEKEEPIVWLLWGAKAKGIVPKLNPLHLYLEAVHPSPRSAEGGFFGCKHFSKCNAYLETNGLTKIEW